MNEWNVPEQDAAAARRIMQQYGKENRALLEQLLEVQALYGRFDADKQHWFGRVGASLNAAGQLSFRARRSYHLAKFGRGTTQADVVQDSRLGAWQQTADRLRAENEYTLPTDLMFGHYLTQLLPDLTSVKRKQLSRTARHYTSDELREYIGNGQGLDDLSIVAHDAERAALLEPGKLAGSRLRATRVARAAASDEGIKQALDNAVKGAVKLGWTRKRIHIEVDVCVDTSC